MSTSTFEPNVQSFVGSVAESSTTTVIGMTPASTGMGRVRSLWSTVKTLSSGLAAAAIGAAIVLVLAATASAQWTPGDPYMAATLGSGSYFTAPSFDYTAGGPPVFSMEAWVKLGTGADAGIAQLDTGAGSHVTLYTRWDAGSSNHELFFNATTGPTPVDFASSARITPGVWTHVVGSYDGSDAFVWVNGTVTTDASWGGEFFRPLFTTNTWGRTTSTGSTLDLNGETSGFRVWNTTITPTTTDSVVNATFGPPTPATLFGNFQVGTNGTTTTLAGSPVGGNLTAQGSNVAYTKNGGNTVVVTVDGFNGGKPVTVDDGILQLGNGGTVGGVNANVVVNASGTLAINRSDDLTIPLEISGAGGVSKLGTNTITLTGNNTYAGTSVLSAGTVIVGDGATSGTLGSGNATNDGVLVFDRSDSVTFGGDISGTGSLTQEGTGTLILTGTNSYAGTTTIKSGGTLQIGSGAGSGSLGTAAVINDGDLVFDKTGSYAVANNISGTGDFAKNGTGVMTYSGTGTYTGLTSINGGTLVLTGSVQGGITPQVSTVLAGSGTMGGTLGGGGSVDPGTPGSPATAASNGILTAFSLSSAPTSFNFEFTAADPDYADATASDNDVLRLTGANPFDAALASANVVNIYLNVDGHTFGDEYRGGFFTDTQSNFLASVQDATFNFFLKDASGSVSYNGVSYSDVTSVGWVLSTVPVTATFAGGPVNGQVLQVVPEPSSFALAGMALAGLAATGYARRRRRVAAASAAATAA